MDPLGSNQNQNPQLPQDPQDNMAGQQGYIDPQNYAQGYPQQGREGVPIVPGQGDPRYMSSQTVPVVTPTPSVEAGPAKVEHGAERLVAPEISPESVKPEEKKETKKQAEQTDEKMEETGEMAPDQKKFESPFRLYGYQASAKALAGGKRASKGGVRVSGDIGFAKTWLLVLLARLLKIYREAKYSAS